MKIQHQFNKTIFYKTIGDLPKKELEDLKRIQNLYFHPEYLLSIEKNNSHLDYFYVVIKDKHDSICGFTSIQIIDFYLDTLTERNQNIFSTIACYARKLKILPEEKPLKILSCGNAFVSGEHGIYLREDQNKKKLLKQISKSILHYSKENDLHASIDIFILKDFLEESLSISNELISLGYYAFNVEPNMKMIIEKNWTGFDDYLAALKTKFRVKAKKAMKLSNDLSVEEMNSKTVDISLKEMTELYDRVASKADFNLGEFRLKTYKSLKSELKQHYILRSYKLHNKMVGFMSGMINGKTLDAHFVGINYDLNRQYAIYQRMLYDYIDMAIKNKLQVINFGRTASEIKSSVGAFPEHLTIYIRHKKSITNKFLRLFLLKIQPTEFHQKFPFKTLSN